MVAWYCVVQLMLLVSLLRELSNRKHYCIDCSLIDFEARQDHRVIESPNLISYILKALKFHLCAESSDWCLTEGHLTDIES